MRESIRLFVAAEGHSSETVDAAPGIEPPPAPEPRALEQPSPPATLWMVTTTSGSRMLSGWSADREVIDKFVSRRGYKNTRISRLDASNEISGKSVQGPPSPRDYCVDRLFLCNDAIDELIDAGIKTLGQVADMPIEMFRKFGYQPSECRHVQKYLAKYGLKLSFELLPGEGRWWSAKRKSGLTA
jgi:hypothetical protein